MIEPNREYILNFERPIQLMGGKTDEIKAECTKTISNDNPCYWAYSFKLDKESPSLSIVKYDSPLEEESGEVIVPEKTLVELNENTSKDLRARKKGFEGLLR